MYFYCTIAGYAQMQGEKKSNMQRILGCVKCIYLKNLTGEQLLLWFIIILQQPLLRKCSKYDFYCEKKGLCMCFMIVSLCVQLAECNNIFWAGSRAHLPNCINVCWLLVIYKSISPTPPLRKYFFGQTSLPNWIKK